MRRPLPAAVLLVALLLPLLPSAAGSPPVVVEAKLDVPQAVAMVTDASGFVRCQFLAHATVTRVGGAYHVVLEKGASRAETRTLARPLQTGTVSWSDPCLEASGPLTYGWVASFTCDGATGSADGFMAPTSLSPWRLAFTATGPCAFTVQI